MIIIESETEMCWVALSHGHDFGVIHHEEREATWIGPPGSGMFCDECRECLIARKDNRWNADSFIALPQ